LKNPKKRDSRISAPQDSDPYYSFPDLESQDDMKKIFRAAACASIFATLPAHAAYKCTVDGKTTYQDAPCADDVKQKGGQKEVAPPSRKADLISDAGSVSKAENDRRKSIVKSDLEPLARSAFDAYKGGRMMEYRDMACLDLRRALSKPEYVQALKGEGADFAKRKVELGKLEPVNVAEMLTFEATEFKDPGKTSNRPQQQLYVNFSFSFDEGRACVRGISAYSKEIR
jgi:hypothetical protein